MENLKKTAEQLARTENETGQKEGGTGIMTQQFITMTITITVKIPVPPTPPAPAGAKAPEPVFLFREGQPPLCRCKVRYGKQAA